MLRYNNYFLILIFGVLLVSVLFAAPKEFDCVKTGHPANISNETGSKETTCGSNHDLCCIGKLVDNRTNNIYFPNDRFSIFIHDGHNSDFGKGYKDVIANSLIDLNLPNFNLDITMDGSSQSFTNYNQWKNACEN